jgi:hypothetical protein
MLVVTQDRAQVPLKQPYVYNKSADAFWVHISTAPNTVCQTFFFFFFKFLLKLVLPLFHLVE